MAGRVVRRRRRDADGLGLAQVAGLGEVVELGPLLDRPAAEAFFRSARAVTESVPERVTTDGHAPYPGALTAELGAAVPHRTNRYLNNRLYPQ